MTDTPASPDDSLKPWNPDEDDSADSGGSTRGEGNSGGDQGDFETYAIPGGLSGWVPGAIPPPNSDGTVRKPQHADTAVRKTPRRQEPRPPEAPTVRRKRASSERAWELLGFNLLVFLSSICVMTLELTASRLIAKHVGSSLYTWTSVIGVVLAGITLGNSLGGWLADRYSRPRTLGWMYFLSSIACTSVLWLDQLVGHMPRPESISWPSWVLIVVSLIFLLPAVLLGTTSPIVASMALERSTRTGTTVGNVYAWGAFGSIVGTFLTGFYLIDVWGTRAIVGMTAGTLAGLALIVASKRWIFRTAVLVGWLQLLAGLWLAATITSPSAEAVASTCGLVLAGGDSGSRTAHNWTDFGNRLGEKLHELGLLLRLRDDQPGAYHDESSYSYIQVRDDYVDGSPVRALRLDKLDHSYFNPADPTRLHYEYEQVYAAITQRAAPPRPSEISTRVPTFPGRDELLTDLPDGVRFDPASNLLTITSATPELLEKLRSRSPEAGFWQAIDRLRTDTNKAQWGGFSAIELESLPDSIEFPDALHYKISYDQNLQALSAYEALSETDVEDLAALGDQAPWRETLRELEQQSAALNTLFIGGGGFIFPRWVLKEFPASQRIDIAELDPAVYQAVKSKMGLTAAEDARMHTVIGDARNFVDDRVRENVRRRAAGEPEIQYDFIYGDAFNDFSVPWHLTTQEFTRKIHDLLTQRGVFLANIIEIYPRTELPGGTVESAVTDLVNTPFPEALLEPFVQGRIRKVKPEFAPLAISGPLQLRFTGAMTSAQEEKLLALAPDDGDWLVAVSQLAERSRARQPLPVTLPEELRAPLMYELTWTPCPEPFAGVDVFRLDQDQFALGLRGAVSDALRDRLLALKAGDAQWGQLISDGVRQSRRQQAGRFLGRYLRTMTTLFPYVAVFCTSDQQPSAGRDTFVVACSRSVLDLKNLSSNAGWNITPFAEFVRTGDSSTPELRGQMDSLLELAGGEILTDDFAPVDNLLRAVFTDQDR